MERRDTWLSRWLQGTQVTTENNAVILTTHSLDRYRSSFSHTHTQPQLELQLSGFQSELIPRNSRAINKRRAISGSVIYSPERQR